MKRILQVMVLGLLALQLPVAGAAECRQSPGCAELGVLVSGEVAEVLVKQGSAVRKGQLLLKLDETPFKARVSAAEARLQADEAQLRQAERELEPAGGREAGPPACPAAGAFCRAGRPRVRLPGPGGTEQPAGAAVAGAAEGRRQYRAGQAMSRVPSSKLGRVGASSENRREYIHVGSASASLPPKFSDQAPAPLFNDLQL